MTTTAAQRQALGAYGEDVALAHLREQGMRLLARNWRCEWGELDLILREGDTLVACEVKTRSSAICGTPHEAITAAKLERLHRLVRRWADDHGVSPADIRVDLVAVIRPHAGRAVVEHVRGLG